MDELPLCIAALECGHHELLCEDPGALDTRLALSGRRLSVEGSVPILMLSDAAVAGPDIVAAPIELSDHPLCVVGLVLHLLAVSEVGHVRVGAGPIATSVLSRELAERNRDGGNTLVSSLRTLERLALLLWDREAGEVRVGPALAAQPSAASSTAVPAAEGAGAFSLRDHVDILEAMAALRASGAPVDARRVRGLEDPRLREAIEARLAGEGRVLLSAAPDAYSVGYSDEIGAALADRGIGLLEPVDRAVLCLALLHCVAIPRARSRGGGADDSWYTGVRVSLDHVVEQHRSDGPSRESIVSAVGRLKHLGLLRMGHDIAPGPALQRLTPWRRAELWEDLVLVCAPASSRARHIREQREGRAA